MVVFVKVRQAWRHWRLSPLSRRYDRRFVVQIADLLKSAHPAPMATGRIIAKISLGALAACLTGCDPGVHVAWEKDFPGTIDTKCIENALRSVAPDVTRTSYVDNGIGTRGFPAGITVIQFNYSDPTFTGGYSLDMARLPNGTTHYWHGWNKLGTGIPSDEQAKVMPLLNRANESVSKACGLSFAGSAPQIGRG